MTSQDSSSPIIAFGYLFIFWGTIILPILTTFTDLNNDGLGIICEPRKKKLNKRSAMQGLLLSRKNKRNTVLSNYINTGRNSKGRGCYYYWKWERTGGRITKIKIEVRAYRSTNYMNRYACNFPWTLGECDENMTLFVGLHNQLGKKEYKKYIVDRKKNYHIESILPKNPKHFIRILLSLLTHSFFLVRSRR